GSESLKGGARVHRQYDADSEARCEDERHRPHTELVEVANDLGPLVRWPHGFDDGAGAEGGEIADRLQGRQHEGADAVDEQHALHRVDGEVCNMVAYRLMADNRWLGARRSG